MSTDHKGAYVEYAPLNVPKPFGENVWIVDGPEIRMDLGPLKVPFPTRMTVVRLEDGGLWLHSPIAPDEALFAEIEKLGEVRWLIAPNSIHYWYMADWIERYPQAQTLAVPDLDVKAKRPFRIDTKLEDGTRFPWSDEIDWLLVPGHELQRGGVLREGGGPAGAGRPYRELRAAAGTQSAATLGNPAIPRQRQPSLRCAHDLPSQNARGPQAGCEDAGVADRTRHHDAWQSRSLKDVSAALERAFRWAS